MIRTLFLLLWLPASAWADSLVQGAVYFDSLPSLWKAQRLSETKDNRGIMEMLDQNYISGPTENELEIEVLSRGDSAESASEFRFLNAPTTFWTLTRLIKITPKPTPTPQPTPTPEKLQKSEKPPFDDDGGLKIWHKVDGTWKYRWKNGKPPERQRVRKALPAPQSTGHETIPETD